MIKRNIHSYIYFAPSKTPHNLFFLIRRHNLLDEDIAEFILNPNAYYDYLSRNKQYVDVTQYSSSD